MIKLKLDEIVNTDKDGKPIKDRDGNLTYIRYDAFVIAHLLNTVDTKAVAVNEYKALIGLDDKFREVMRQGVAGEMELTIDEGTLLKKLLSNPQNDKVNYGIFHIRTINAVLEQLK